MTSPIPVLRDEHQLVHVRHYPLNMDLPFERYEHRRLAARDILVHRIMSKLLFPGSKGLARVLDTLRDSDPRHHNFGMFREYDEVLARDLQLLRKMLVTTSITEHVNNQPVEAVGVNNFPIGGPGAIWVGFWDRFHEQSRFRNIRNEHQPVTVGEEIMDLIRRHYFETDDPSMRLWLHAARPLIASSYNTLTGVLQAKHTRAASAQQRIKVDQLHGRREEKRWYPADTEHLRSLQEITRTSFSLDVYDGGALLPPLRDCLMRSHASRKKYLDMKAKQGDSQIALTPEKYWSIVKDNIYPRPGANAPRMVLEVRSWQNSSLKYPWYRDTIFAPPVDFSSGRTGRGMDRDGIWSTGRWVEEEGDRGRPGRRGRRRASSEPPPEMFTSAWLPCNFHHPRDMLIFPKMNLVTADRRSRRRSLSRTHIAEMFDWNTVFTAQSAEENIPVKVQGQPGRQPAGTPSPPTRVHKIEQRIGDLRYWTPENFVWRDMNGLCDDVLVNLHSKGYPLKPCFHSSGPGSCANCTCTGHATSECRQPCGFCGAPSSRTLHPAGTSRKLLSSFANDKEQPAGQHRNLHMASNCPVARHNRCKCGPFPQYHVATICPVLCSRHCGNGQPPGRFRHKNAMTCRARCCMCGTKGHSGQQCKLKRCRCGRAHLGQDCRWKVECRVKGCDKYLCGVHCIDCGIARGELGEELAFHEGRCPSCLSETDGVTANDVKVEDGDNGQEGDGLQVDTDTHVQRPAAKKGGRKNIRKRRDSEGTKKEKEELPWYAPLQPLTRLIVTSKSGKKNTWRN